MSTYTTGQTPLELGESLDAIVLGGMRSPGVVTLSGHDRWQSWDIQQARGREGATSQLQGRGVGQFSARFVLSAPEDFERWPAFAALVSSMTEGPAPSALPVYHPDLARNQFTEVSSGGIGGMTYDGKGGAAVEVRFVEYRPPRPRRVAPATGGADKATGATRPEAPDPNAARKAELARLRAQAERLRE